MLLKHKEPPYSHDIFFNSILNQDILLYNPRSVPFVIIHKAFIPALV